MQKGLKIVVLLKDGSLSSYDRLGYVVWERIMGKRMKILMRQNL